MATKNPVREWLRRKLPKTARHKAILGFERWKALYDKGLAVIASIRLVEITDIAILMGAIKYLFGDNMSIWWVVAAGAFYYPARTVLYFLIGWFWENNDGFRIQAEVSGKRAIPGRMVLINPDGREYGMKELAREIAMACRNLEDKKNEEEER